VLSGVRCLEIVGGQGRLAELMAGYLPKEWTGKRVGVKFGEGSGFDAKLVGDNAGGINLEAIKEGAEEEHPLRAFVPWTAVRYIRLVEETGEAGHADEG
jgi:hypothetical protein